MDIVAFDCNAALFNLLAYFQGPYELLVESVTKCEGKRMTNLVKVNYESIIDAKNGLAYLNGNSTSLKSGSIVGVSR